MKRIEIKPGVRVFIQGSEDDEPTEVTNWLYEFEECGIKTVDGKGHYENYKIWIEIEEE